MKYLFELSKEHETLPKAEILACLQSEKVEDYYIIESNKDVLIIEINSNENSINSLARRLAYTYYIDQFLFTATTSKNDIKKQALDHILQNKGSIAVKYKNRSKNIDSTSIVRTLADVYTKDRKVTLNKPDNEIRALITDSAVYIGLKLAEIDRSQFEERRVQNRPFFSPISLHPKLARALVNLSSINKDETLLDPFCGTGGILIEAGLMGSKLIGSDIENKMIEGCKKTLDFYKIKNYELYCSDIGEIDKHLDKAEAIVTDLPYGKSTTTKGEEMNRLYERAFYNISKLLKENGKAVIGLSNEDFISLGKKYFSLVEKHDFRVHRSLTRYFAVYKK